MGRPPRTPKDAATAAEIGKRIRSARLAVKPRKLTQRQLAELVDVTESTVCDWEKGRATPTGTRIARVAAALGVSPAFLTPAKLADKEGLELRAADLVSKVGPRLMERMLEVPTHPLRVAIGRAIEDYHAQLEKTEAEEQSS